MSPPPVDRFALLIRQETGNVVPAARHGFLGDVLDRRARALGLPGPGAYVDQLGGGGLPGEWERVVSLVTVKESYFFRAPQQFAAIERHVLPRILGARAADEGRNRVIRAWSAACARGEETGTLAILFAESELLRGWEWEIVGTDLDSEALDTARRGLYGERAVAHVPPAQLGRWFRPRGKLFQLAPELSRRIAFRPLNLARPPYDLLGGPRAPAFDLILLRNVLIYFHRPLQRRVVQAVAAGLADEGALFLGASETFWQIQGHLAPHDLGNCFCYRHRPPAAREGSPAGPRRGTPAPPPPPPPAPTSPRPVSEASAPSAVPAAEPAPPSGDHGLLAELERQVDDDASHLHAEPCGIQERLARAAAKLAADRLDEAAETLDEVLEADPSEPGAHALDGFLRDLRGEPEEAITSYRAALYLDPALYQIRLLLADSLRRGGHRDRADQEYRQVLAALASGRARSIPAFAPLPLPGREGAERRCRDALRGRAG